MTKYVFGKEEGEILFLDDEGELTTDSMYADIKYKINRDDYDVELTIKEQCFDTYDLGELIGFLQAIKEELSK